MLFALMKFVTWLLSPLMLGLAGVLAGGYWVWRDQTRRGLWTLAASLVWLWIWSSPWFLILFGGALERGFPPAKVESLPRADAIVVLGGGIARRPLARVTRSFPRGPTAAGMRRGVTMRARRLSSCSPALRRAPE